MKQGRGREGDLASHEHFHFHLNGIGIKESCVVGFHISHFITISKWAESAFWWFSSLLLWGNFFCCVWSVILCLGVPPRWRDSQSCSLWAQAQQQPLYRLLACAIQRRAHPRPHAQEEERDQSTLTESHLPMSNPLSWTRRFRLPRTPSWTGRAGSSSTGSPPLPSPLPPLSPPPLVYLVKLFALQVVVQWISVDSLQNWFCFMYLHCLTDIYFEISGTLARIAFPSHLILIRC